MIMSQICSLSLLDPDLDLGIATRREQTHFYLQFCGKENNSRNSKNPLHDDVVPDGVPHGYAEEDPHVETPLGDNSDDGTPPGSSQLQNCKEINSRMI